LGPELVQRNYVLALHLIQRHSGAKVHYQNNLPEIDHIFPRSILRQRKLDQALVEHFANFWILAKGKNQIKSNSIPKQYFADVSDAELHRALILRDLLEYDKYPLFLAVRTKAIVQSVAQRTGLSEQDFPKVVTTTHLGNTNRK